jgi:hypothetical protein
MSSAFVKESDDQWLEDIAPTMSALVNFLTRESNGIRIHEIKNFQRADGVQVFEMSNGVSYSKHEGRWKIVI